MGEQINKMKFPFGISEILKNTSKVSDKNEMAPHKNESKCQNFDAYDIKNKQFSYDFNQVKSTKLFYVFKIFYYFLIWFKLHFNAPTKESTKSLSDQTRMDSFQQEEDSNDNNEYFGTDQIDLRQSNDTVENLNIIKMLLLSHNKNYYDMILKNFSYHYSNLKQTEPSNSESVNSTESINPSPSSSSKQNIYGENYEHFKVIKYFRKKCIRRWRVLW